MPGRRSLILLILVLSVNILIAQEAWEIDPMPVRLKGMVLSREDNAPVPYAHVVNNRTHGGTITNASGIFTLDMLNVDSLTMSSIGFFKETFSVPYNYHADSIVTFYMKPVSIAVRQVDVTGEKPVIKLDGVPSGKPVNIAPELRGDAFNEKPPTIAAFLNPVSFLYYYLDKDEKRKRKVREAMLLEKNWEMHSENYNKEVVKLLTGLNDFDADVFMVWFNSQNVLPYTSTEYEVRAAIKEQFETYKQLRGLD